MQKEPLIAGAIIVAGIIAANVSLDGRAVPDKKLPGGIEACTYHAGPKDQEMVEEGGAAGQEILRSILKLERKCQFVTLVLADGTRHEMKLGPAGRKPGEKGPSSMGDHWEP